MKHKFELIVTTDSSLDQDQIYCLVSEVLQVGQAYAEDTVDSDASDDARTDAMIVRDMDFGLRSLTPIKSTNLLVAQANGFDNGLDELGFGADDGINGGDCVEFIDQNQALLRRLPALAELASAVGVFLDAKVPEDGSYSQIITPLIDAYQKTKGA